MIGLVIVSHSAKLAEGIRDLANQMTQNQVPLAIAGGIEDPENPIGTDAFKVQEAIEAVYSDDGVVVLMDLGSALLSAEMALDFLADTQRPNVYLCEAPLVEGAVAAAVQAMVGGNVSQVIAEARSALTAKVAQLQGAIPDLAAANSLPGISSDSANEIFLTIGNRLGLHARPAAQFVSTAARFDTPITVRNVTKTTGPVNAKSINQVATLGARQGHQIAVSATGPQAEAALAALTALVEANFGENEGFEAIIPQPVAPQAQPAAGAITGIPASPGIAIGPAMGYHPRPLEVPERHIDDPATEWQRLEKALTTAQQEIETLHRQAQVQVGAYKASIFAAHLLFLSDPALLDTVRQQIFEQKINAEAGWQTGINQMVANYQALDDPYLQARATDVADVGQRVLKILAGVAPTSIVVPVPSILVAVDLTPSDTAQLNSKKILGICTELGSSTSHSAILARALGIPAVAGVGANLSGLADGTPLALDGQAGLVWVRPEAEQLSRLKEQQADWLNRQAAAKSASAQPAITRDGRRVEVAANVGQVADIYPALDNGAEGVGLLRTEFLYLDRQTPPSEEEQLAAYQAIATALDQRPFIIRTLDIGGDKPLPYLDLGQEQNPFLGWRAIRYCLDQPAILKTQLRAILRASPGHQVKIMFPMVATVTEIRSAKKILAAVQAELQQAEVAVANKIEVGVMIEVPAAAIVADQLAREVDFFSIGTNDLSQYTMAADRTNPRVAHLADAFQPAVLRLIRQIIQTAHAANIWVGMCGEMAGNPLATAVLLGLGLDEFSMSGPAIPLVKQTITQLTAAEAEEVATEVLKLDSAEAIREYLNH
jgi:phosphocarrier protein FPr